jgi:hypothetical protein
VAIDGGLTAVAEEEEEDEEEGETEVDAAVHVPQAFSHFTHSTTGGQKLVCDLQVSGRRSLAAGSHIPHCCAVAAT